MGTLPKLDKSVNNSPHVVIIGAGASIASWIDSGRKGPPLPSMANLINTLGLRPELSKSGYLSAKRNFEAFYSDLVESGKNPHLQELIEDRVWEYFRQLTLPDEPTIYDYLIAGLRPKDLIASFNWDPFLLQAYRRSEDKLHLPQIVFLHGNVDVGVCYQDKVVSIRNAICPKCGHRFAPSKMMFPVKSKNYNSDPLIKNEWGRLQFYLGQAYFLTVFGYSAPKTDIEARSLMLDVWKKNPTHTLAEVEVIDTAPEPKVERSWQKFFHSHHYGITQSFFESQIVQFPRRSCDAFAAASLMAEPWEDNPFPRFKSVKALWEWVRPLIAEEDRYEKMKEPFSGKPLGGTK